MEKQSIEEILFVFNKNYFNKQFQYSKKKKRNNFLKNNRFIC